VVAVTVTDVYIYILLDTVLATDVNKYSLASGSCQPIWRTLVGELDLFLAVAKDCGIVVYLNQGSHASWKVLDFFLENSRTWKVLENTLVLESHGN